MPSSSSRSRSLRPALLAVVALILCVLPARASDAPQASTPDAQRLTFLLQYIGTDYGDAVRDGAIVNDFEYGEVLRFVRQLIHDYGARRTHSAAVVDGLKQLERQMVARAPADEVWARTRRLLPELRRSVGYVAGPERIPNLATGRRLWVRDCSMCHGESGAGDGTASSDMDPPATAFRGEYLERLSPQQVFDAVSIGVEGTAMPSFADVYDDTQRWDVAFFTMTLRVGFQPMRPSFAERFDLTELAASSNAELMAKLRQTQPSAKAEHVDWFRVNLVSAGGQVAPLAGPEAAHAGGVTLALQMQDAFAAVADRVFPRVVGVAGYVRDPSWTEQRLRVERGDGWINANADALRYPGFRRIRTGSGLLIDDEGYVLTSDQLVRDDARALAPLVEVELQDEKRIVSAIIGAEPTIDLAVLRIAEATPALPALELGDSDRLETGHWLIALGDPPGPERTFAVGVVAMPPLRQCYQSALSATRLQSSLVVGPGGLGGPVVDILGHLVGLSVGQEMETGVASPTGILPINLVLNLFEALKVARSDRSPWIGISVLELAAAERLLASRVPAVATPATGLYIDDVFSPSPAYDAGIRPGDFLVSLGGHAVLSVSDFQTWLYSAGIDSKVDLELVRNGERLTIPVVIEARPPSASTH